MGDDDDNKVISFSEYKKEETLSKERVQDSLEDQAEKNLHEILNFFDLENKEHATHYALNFLGMFVKNLKKRDQVYALVDNTDKSFFVTYVMCACAECVAQYEGVSYSLITLEEGHCRECKEVFDFSIAQWSDRGSPYCSSSCFNNRQKPKGTNDDKKDP